MASLTIDAKLVREVRFDNTSKFESVANADLSGGKYFRVDGTSGKAVAAEGDTAALAGTIRWLLLRDAKAGDAITGYRGALIDLGASALDGLAFGTPLYLADDGGITATASESTATILLGWVVPKWTSGGGSNRLFQQVKE